MNIRDEQKPLDDRTKTIPKSKFLLSTIALVCGWLAWLAHCGHIAKRVEAPTAESSISPLLGFQIILGALAYRSVKRTKLGIREESVLRRIGELLALILVWLPSYWLLVLINDPSLWDADPTGNVTIPLWSYIAYLVIVTKQSQMSTMGEESRGLGGWLIPAAISLCITPIMLGISVMRDFLPIFQEGYWDILTTPGSEVYHRLWGPLIIFEIIGNAFFIIFSIILIFLFFTKSYRFPILMIVFMISIFLFLIGDFFLGESIPLLASEDDGEFVKGLFKGIISAMIWIPYLLSSKRAKNTFMKHDSNEPLQSS